MVHSCAIPGEAQFLPLSLLVEEETKSLLPFWGCSLPSPSYRVSSAGHWVGTEPQCCLFTAPLHLFIWKSVRHTSPALPPLSRVAIQTSLMWPYNLGRQESNSYSNLLPWQVFLGLLLSLTVCLSFRIYTVLATAKHCMNFT